jgi:hypothetical protein
VSYEKDLATVIGIKRGDDPGFLSGDQDAFAVGKIGEHGRRSESLNVRDLGR